MNWSRVVDYLIWVALGGIALALITRRSSGPEEGQPAAVFDLKLAGASRRFSLQEQRGKPVLLEMFASWCGACRRSTPTLTEVWHDHRDNVTFLGVMVDDSAGLAAETKRRWEIPYDVAVDDGSVSKNYHIELLPTFVLIDKSGIVRRVWAGTPTRSQLESWLMEL